MNFPRVWYWAESISLGYHSLPCQMTFLDPIQRDSQTRFLSVFFHSSSLPGPLSNGLKYVPFWSWYHRFIRIFCRNLPDLFKFFVEISPGYHTSQSQSPQGIIPRGVTHDPRESLMTPGSQQPFLSTFSQAFKGKVSQNNYGFIFYY